MTDRFPEGLSAQRTVVVSAEMLERFVALSGDTSRLHIDAAFARARGFRGRVVHGLLLGALVSSVIGTELPGDAGVLQELKLGFHNACYEGDKVTITVTVVEHHAALSALTCKVEIRNAAGVLLAKGQFRSGLIETL